LGNIQEIKHKIVEVITILDGESLFEMSTGHVSARVPGTDKICILGHVHHDGRTLDTVTADDIVTMDMDGKLIEGATNPPGEKYIHTAIYQRRPDVMAVVHNHPRLGTAFSIAGQEIYPVSFRGSIFAPKVPVLMYPGQIDTPELGMDVAVALGDGYSVLLQGHGAVSVGSNLEEVCCVAIALEVTAETQLIASQVGEITVIPSEQLDGHFVKGMTAEEYFSIAWSFYSAKHAK
jgi:ribulose-5-phosphate 4-epimerase/fuculose-1-phosphate aldolase